MDISNSKTPILPRDSETFAFNDWQIYYNKSHILKSICPQDGKCTLEDANCCERCKFDHSLQLPHLPDMVFPKNILTVTYKTGIRLEFNALDALKCVESCKKGPQVACAEEWQESRPQNLLSEKVKPFDWTFSSDYQGTVGEGFVVEPTDIKLDIFKLMKKEAILFYHDLTLFEDELHDHGIASCSVKIRVMPSGFFILLRFFLRVDDVLIRINDTRFHYEIGNNFILKEFTSKEARVEKLQHVPPSLFVTPSEIEKHLPVSIKTTHKIIFPN